MQNYYDSEANINADEQATTNDEAIVTSSEQAELPNSHESELTAALRQKVAELEGQLAALLRREQDREVLHELTEATRYQDGDTSARWGNRVLEALAEYINIAQAALYATNLMGLQVLERWATFAVDAEDSEPEVPFGRGMVGQAAQSQMALVFTDNDAAFRSRVSSGIATLPMRALVVLPLVYNNRVEGVLELASFEALSPNTQAIIYEFGERLAAALLSIRSQERLRLLDAQQPNTVADKLAVMQELQTATPAADTTPTVSTTTAAVCSFDDQGCLCMYEALLNTVNDIALVIDHQLNVQFMNQSLKTGALTNTYLEPYVGMPMSELFLEHQNDEFLGYALRALSGEVFSKAIHYDTPDGRVLHYDIDYFPIYDRQNRLMGAACVGRDTAKLAQRDERNSSYTSSN